MTSVATADAPIPAIQDAKQVSGTPASKRAVASTTATKVLSLLPSFVERVRWGRVEESAGLVENMAQALESTHPAVAKQLRRHQPLKPIPMRLPEDLIVFEQPVTRFADVILPLEVEAALPKILQEHARANELAAYHLAPRHKILLEGPPGNGKTLLAQALAGELELPLLRVNYSGLITSHLGETGANLGKAFRYAETAPCVLFLDEFDSIGAARGGNDVGEIRRVTNQLLILIDQLSAHVVLVCATNLKDQVDAALLRRFDISLHIPAPDYNIRLRCAQRELAPVRTPGRDVSHHVQAVAGHAFENLAALVQYCQEIRRDLVLNDGLHVEELVAALQRRVMPAGGCPT